MGEVGVLPPPAGLVAAQEVGQAARRDGDQPGARVVGAAVARPLLRGRQQRLLDRVLAGVEVAVAPDQRAEDLRHQRAQQVLGGRTAGHRSEAASCMIGFTSTRPNRAKGTLAAISRARSSESTSMMSKLPRYSLVSM